jgi:hypothetical protein
MARATSAFGACQTSRTFWTRASTVQRLGVDWRQQVGYLFISRLGGNRVLNRSRTKGATAAVEPSDEEEDSRDLASFPCTAEALPRANCSTTNLSVSDFTKGLFELNNAFVELRYLYEKPSWSGYLEPFPKIGKAVQLLLDEVWPQQTEGLPR